VSEYRAHVIDDARGWDMNVVRLLLWRRRGLDYEAVMPDGTWQVVTEGSYIDGEGIVIPRDSIESIVQAIEEWQGHTSHAETEARVLREWLAVERARVDRVLTP